VGHLLDLPADPPGTDVSAEGLNGRVRWQGLGIAFRGLDPAVITTIEPGTRLAISGASASGKTRLLEILAGLREPDHGFADISGIDVREASRVADGRLVGIARQPEIFCGSLLENVRLGRSWLTNTDVRIALERVGLWDTVLAGAGGLDASLQSGGYPLSYSQCVRLMLARALVAQPQVLLIDGTLDLLAPQERFSLWQHLIGDSSARTIIIATHDAQIMAACDRNIECADAVNHQAH
jgi:ABC-type transport system involved in cytochrome bd biosynthesis fused ATPase/permease subunit